jgi:hypothetical protein
MVETHRNKSWQYSVLKGLNVIIIANLCVLKLMLFFVGSSFAENNLMLLNETGTSFKQNWPVRGKGIVTSLYTDILITFNQKCEKGVCH